MDSFENACIKISTCSSLHVCLSHYSKFRNLRENFIFANSVKIHTWDIKNWEWGIITNISKRQSDLAISRGLYFRETNIREVSRK